MERKNLTRIEKEVLDAIPEGHYVTSGDIAKKMDKLLSNVSSTMKILYIKGYITRIGGFVGLYKKEVNEK